jgi:hypothetical protein
MPLSSFTQAPFNLAVGDQIYVKIRATNQKGESEDSEAGSGAFIITMANAPINLIEDTS